MKFSALPLRGLYIIEPDEKVDARGFFSRNFCQRELKDHAFPFKIAQINRSYTRQKGTVRGLHFQKKPYSEDKIIQCLNGEIYDVAVDIRKNSSTFGKWYGIRLTGKNKKMLLIPKGFAHGFQTLSENCLIEYLVSQFYTPDCEEGVLWNDPSLAIPWPMNTKLVSEKDAKLPPLQNSYDV